MNSDSLLNSIISVENLLNKLADKDPKLRVDYNYADAYRILGEVIKELSGYETRYMTTREIREFKAVEAQMRNGSV